MKKRNFNGDIIKKNIVRNTEVYEKENDLVNILWIILSIIFFTIIGLFMIVGLSVEAKEKNIRAYEKHCFSERMTISECNEFYKK